MYIKNELIILLGEEASEKRNNKAIEEIKKLNS